MLRNTKRAFYNDSLTPATLIYRKIMSIANKVLTLNHSLAHIDFTARKLDEELTRQKLDEE